MRWAVIAVFVALSAPRASDACTPPGGGVYGQTVLPEDGATAVPRNARIVVEYDTWGSDLGNTITLRAQGGADVAATMTATVTAGYGRMLVPDALLTASTTYEVVDDLVFDCDPSRSAPCTGTPVVIATFTTADALDSEAPSLTGVTADSGATCPVDSCPEEEIDALTDITVGGVSDDGPQNHVRFEYFASDGTLLAGPTSGKTIGQYCGGDVPFVSFIPIGNDVVVRAVDLAGNLEATPHPIVGASSCNCDLAGDAGPTDDAGNAIDNSGGGCGCASTDPRGALIPILIVAFALSRAPSRRP